MMKKLTALMLSLLLVLSAMTALVSATDSVGATAAPEWTTKQPDLLITEICPDTAGDGTGGYSDGKDVFEMFEIYNNSDVTLNLYDYCIVYNGNGTTNAMFENAIIEITPFLTNNKWEDKPGNYIDGSTMVFGDGASYEMCDLSNMPTNPETCYIEPGECVVVWSMYHEAYYALWNEGKGMSIDDFRTFWNIPDDVKVLAWDGSSNTANYGGNDKNFNLKNSGCGTYGIAKYSDMLNLAANTEPTATAPDGTETKYGKINIYDEKTFREFEDLVSWIVLDFDYVGLKTTANLSYTYVVDDKYIDAEMHGFEADMRRGALVEYQCEPTPGKLNDTQKLMLSNYKFSVGETVTIPSKDDIELFIYEGWYKDESQPIEALMINGTKYELGSTFTATAAGTITVEPVFAEAEETTKAPETTKKPEESTKAPETNAPETNAPETNAPEATDAPTTTEAPASSSGCGSSVAYIAVAVTAMLGTAVVFKKKK